MNNNDFAQLEALGKHPGWHTEPILAISQLKIGNTIQGQLHGKAYQVVRITEDGCVFVVRELEITNPSEWRLVINDQVSNGE